MPELPEVEITVRGIAPHITGKTISQVIVRNKQLRTTIRDDISKILSQCTVKEVKRRAKYVLIILDAGILVIHLGMSGSLLILPNSTTKPQKHDHIDVIFNDDTVLRYRDPRRFGLFEWFNYEIENIPLFRSLGVEPLSSDFDADYLYRKIQKRTMPVKQLLMNAQIVVGIGNIYANEVLFLSKINPKTVSGRLSYAQCEELVANTIHVLNKSIENGGSTLRDFKHSDGTNGYFQQSHLVYGKENAPCCNCNTPIKRITLGQRSTFFCPVCQPDAF